MFLFGCYTGLRSSDLLTLQKQHILETERGYFLKKVAYKTGKLIRLPLYNLFKQDKKELSLPEEMMDTYLGLIERKYLGVSNKEQLIFPVFGNVEKSRKGFDKEIENSNKSRNQRHNILLKTTQKRRTHQGL